MKKNLQKVTENAIGTLAPHANYGWFPTGPTSGSTATKSGTSYGNTQKVKSGPKLNPMTSYQTMGPPPTKMATFDGKSEWNQYLVQFNMTANRCNWTMNKDWNALLNLSETRH